MSLSLILGCIWVVVGAITAMMPMRFQIYPGSVLLITAIPLLVFIGFENGWWMTVIGVIAFLSMFRRPLFYLGRRALGLSVTLPQDAEEIRK